MTPELIATSPVLVELADGIRRIVAEELEVPLDELTDSADFVDEYDADSLSLITVVARIEKELGVAVPRDRFEDMSNLDGVFAVVAEHAGREPAGD
ncbi:MAG: acyl carrier protein [Mycobacteriales bacterium]|jgi:acyl carrier protein